MDEQPRRSAVYSLSSPPPVDNCYLMISHRHFPLQMNDRSNSNHFRPQRPSHQPSSETHPLRQLDSNAGFGQQPASPSARAGSSTGSSLPHSYESSFASYTNVSVVRGPVSPSFHDSGYDSVGSPHVLSLLATERDEELGTMFAMSIEDLPGQYEDGDTSTPMQRTFSGVVSPGLPLFHASPPPGTFRPLSPPPEPQNGDGRGGRGSVVMSRREWRSVSTQTPPGARGRNSRVRPRSAPLYEEREDSASDDREDEEEADDDESVFMPTITTVAVVEISQVDQVDGDPSGPLRPPLPDLLPERRPRSASVPALSRIYEQQVGEQLRELGDSIFRERLVGPRSLPTEDPLRMSTSLNPLGMQRRNSVSQSIWDLWIRLVNMAQGQDSSQ